MGDGCIWPPYSMCPDVEAFSIRERTEEGRTVRLDTFSECWCRLPLPVCSEGADEKICFQLSWQRMVSIFLYYRDAARRTIKRATLHALESELIFTFELVASLCHEQHEVSCLYSRLCSHPTCLGNCVLFSSLNPYLRWILDRLASYKSVLQWMTLPTLAMQPSMGGRLFKHSWFSNQIHL